MDIQKYRLMLNVGHQFRDDNGDLVATLIHQPEPLASFIPDDFEFVGERPKLGDPVHPSIWRVVKEHLIP
jgi:hypothetical protein